MVIFRRNSKMTSFFFLNYDTRHAESPFVFVRHYHPSYAACKGLDHIITQKANKILSFFTTTVMKVINIA